MSASSRISRSSEFYGDSRVSGWTRLLVLWILLILPSWRTVALRKKKYIDIPIPHSNIYDRWAIQECFTRIFLQKIVLFHTCWAVITSTLVRSREFRATPKQWRQLKKPIIDKVYRLTSSAKQWCYIRTDR